MSLAHALEDVGAGDVGQRLGQFEEAVGAIAAGMDDALGNALMVEVEDLLAEVEVLQQRRAARALPQGVLVVGDRDALLGRQHRVIAARDLMGLAAGGLNLSEGVRQVRSGRRLRRPSTSLSLHRRIGLTRCRGRGRFGRRGLGHRGLACAGVGALQSRCVVEVPAATQHETAGRSQIVLRSGATPSERGFAAPHSGDQMAASAPRQEGPWLRAGKLTFSPLLVSASDPQRTFGRAALVSGASDET